MVKGGGNALHQVQDVCQSHDNRRMQQFEQLGLFYLGKRYDLTNRSRLDDLVLYDAKDLVTHAVCVGMTGSGKTGLCVSLIEEAAIDGVPTIAIDPKGDLSNLLLTFPALAPADFRPWIDEDEARRAGVSADDYAKQQAETWKKGLAEWGQDGARIERLRAAAEFAVYTPGSSAGLPLSLQIVGRHFDEATVLRIGHAYERATTWRQRRPQL